MTVEESSIQTVIDFLKALEGGTKAHVRDAYDTYFAEDCIYQNSGLPDMDKPATMDFFFSDMEGETGIVKLVADITHIAATGNVVFTERVDHHYDKDGNDILTPSICGIFEVKNGQFTRWADYFDPNPMLHLFGMDETGPTTE